MIPLTEYIILFYGLGTPFFYAIYKLTIASMEKRDRNRQEREFKNNYGNVKYPVNIDTPPIINPLEETLIRMKEVIQNDNISTQDRITILKARLKEKKK
jgi:hypothetical protein